VRRSNSAHGLGLRNTALKRDGAIKEGTKVGAIQHFILEESICLPIFEVVPKMWPPYAEGPRLGAPEVGGKSNLKETKRHGKVLRRESLM